MGAHLVGVVGELDATGLAPPADLHLRLDDDRVAGLVGLLHRLVDRDGDATGADGDAEAAEVLLALVLEQIHGRPAPLGLRRAEPYAVAVEAEQPAARMGDVPTSPAPRPAAAAGRLRSPFARAVVPVAGGIAVIGLLLLVTWGIAAYISAGGADSTERLAPVTFRVGGIEARAESIAEDGPLIFPGLDTTSGERTLVLDHEGTDATRGWRVYWAYPADGDPSCAVEQVRGTREFVDCDARRLEVTALAPADGVRPIVENRTTLILDLRGATGG